MSSFQYQTERQVFMHKSYVFLFTVTTNFLINIRFLFTLALFPTFSKIDLLTQNCDHSLFQMPCNNCANHQLVEKIEQLLESFKENYIDMENEISLTSNVFLRCHGAKVCLTVYDKPMGLNIFDSVTRVTADDQIAVLQCVLDAADMAISTVLERFENDLPSNETPIVIDD